MHKCTFSTESLSCLAAKHRIPITSFSQNSTGLARRWLSDLPAMKIRVILTIRPLPLAATWCTWATGAGTVCKQLQANPVVPISHISGSAVSTYGQHRCLPFLVHATCTFTHLKRHTMCKCAWMQRVFVCRSWIETSTDRPTSDVCQLQQFPTKCCVHSLCRYWQSDCSDSHRIPPLRCASSARLIRSNEIPQWWNPPLHTISEQFPAT